MKYTLDTNLYIGSFRNPAEYAELAEFESAYTPMLCLTSIVAHELLSGARSREHVARVTRHVVAPFKQRGRIATPGYNEWKMAGTIRADLAARGRRTITGSFLNDIMLAVTCRAYGIVLLTRNAADFSAIHSVFPRFRFELGYPRTRRR